MNALICGYIPPSELRRTSRLMGIRELLGILITNCLYKCDVQRASARIRWNESFARQLSTN
jgi:hypothetical protein